MIEVGSFSLYLTLLFTSYAMGAAVLGALRARPDLVASAERAVYAVFVLLSLAALGLETALLTDRFDLA